MFRENKRIFSILMGVTFLSVILLAAYSMRQGQKLKNDIGSEYQRMEERLKTNDKKEELQIKVTDDNVVTISTDIRYETKHNKCNHKTTENEKPEPNMIGLDRKSFEEYVKHNLPGWKMSMFSKEEIHLLNEKDTLCSKHFIVGEKNGKIAIFTIDEYGKKVIHRIFKDTTISIITEENQKRLKQGIVVDSEEEAIQVLEDFIS